MADGSPSTSETWRFSGDTGTTHGTNNPPIDPQLFITTNSAFYSAPQVSGSVSGTYARATATIQGGGMQEFVREWRKHHTGSTDYDNWYTQVTEVYCNNGSISVVQQPQVWGGNACNSSLKLGQQGSNDRFWGCAKLGRSFTPGSCFNVTTNLSWRTSQSEYACRGDFAGPTVVGGGRHIRNGSTGYWMGSYTAEGCRTVSGSLTNSCTNGALFESSKSCSSTPNGNLCW